MWPCKVIGLLYVFHIIIISFPYLVCAFLQVWGPGPRMWQWYKNTAKYIGNKCCTFTWLLRLSHMIFIHFSHSWARNPCMGPQLKYSGHIVCQVFSHSVKSLFSRLPTQSTHVRFNQLLIWLASTPAEGCIWKIGKGVLAKKSEPPTAVSPLSPDTSISAGGVRPKINRKTSLRNACDPRSRSQKLRNLRPLWK